MPGDLTVNTTYVGTSTGSLHDHVGSNGQPVYKTKPLYLKGDKVYEQSDYDKSVEPDYTVTLYKTPSDELVDRVVNKINNEGTVKKDPKLNVPLKRFRRFVTDRVIPPLIKHVEACKFVLSGKTITFTNDLPENTNTHVDEKGNIKIRYGLDPEDLNFQLRAGTIAAQVEWSITNIKEIANKCSEGISGSIEPLRLLYRNSLSCAKSILKASDLKSKFGLDKYNFNTLFPRLKDAYSKDIDQPEGIATIATFAAFAEVNADTKKTNECEQFAKKLWEVPFTFLRDCTKKDGKSANDRPQGRE